MAAVRIVFTRETPTILDVMERNTNNSMPEPGKSKVGNRLHICVGYSCNNNCLFCMEEDREARFTRLIDQSDDDVRRMMTFDPEATEVMFTSGEPTLHPRLAQFIAMARDLGFPTVGMITNGRLLSYRPYARKLLESGLNHVLVSVHGPDAHVHDGLTRAKGSFDQAMAGLANLLLLKREYPNLKVHTSYVVNKRNYKLFREFFDVMVPFAVDQHVFNVMMPEGRGAEFFDQLVVKYSEVAAEFKKFVDGLSPEGLRKVFMLDIPYCTTMGVKDSARGYVERYFHYEPDSTVLFEDGRDPSSKRPEADAEVYQRKVFDGDHHEFSKVTKTVHDQMVRIKRPECAGCGYNHLCRGVFTCYIDRFGWDEFVPVAEKGGSDNGR
jgi:cyclic pyranopterin phosphate synthase